MSKWQEKIEQAKPWLGQIHNKINYWWCLLPIAAFALVAVLSTPLVFLTSIEENEQVIQLLEQQKIPPVIAQRFQELGYPFSDKSFVEELEPQTSWVIHDHHRSKFTVVANEGKLNIYHGFYKISKLELEEASLILLSIVFVIALVRYLYHRHSFWLWLVLLIGAFLCREIHFVGTSSGIFVALIILLLLAAKKLPQWQAYFMQNKFLNVLFLSFFTYAVSQSVARRVWRFVPGESFFASVTEETLEFLGHCILALLPLVIKDPPQEDSQENMDSKES